MAEFKPIGEIIAPILRRQLGNSSLTADQLLTVIERIEKIENNHLTGARKPAI